MAIPTLAVSNRAINALASVSLIDAPPKLNTVNPLLGAESVAIELSTASENVESPVVAFKSPSICTVAFDDGTNLLVNKVVAFAILSVETEEPNAILSTPNVETTPAF